MEQNSPRVAQPQLYRAACAFRRPWLSRACTSYRVCRLSWRNIPLSTWISPSMTGTLTWSKPASTSGCARGQLVNSALTARKIAQCERRVIGTPSYFKAASVPRIPADLVRHQVIIYEQPLGSPTWIFRQGAAEASVSLGGRVRLNTTVGVRKCVLADLGVAIASEWMFAPELRDKTVKAVLVDWSLPPVEAWAIFPTGRQASAKARTFASFIESQMLNPDRFQQQMGAEN